MGVVDRGLRAITVYEGDRPIGVIKWFVVPISQEVAVRRGDIEVGGLRVTTHATFKPIGRGVEVMLRAKDAKWLVWRVRDLPSGAVVLIPRGLLMGDPLIAAMIWR
ncbi:MAG: hypothetical protein ACP5GZ_11235 [Vulcanisaeta sp.]|uniref:hypothetical protein n=1 Tax=Vulcanisaeta sp. TaxID=2020871 RepID=UPI003D09D100